MSYVTGKSPTPLQPGNDNLASGVARKNWNLLAWQFSAVESEIYPFDPKVVKAIRELDSAFVPLVIRSVYGTNTGEVRHYEHHGIAWALKHAKKKHERRRILWPTHPNAVNHGKGGATLFLEVILRDDDLDNGLPGRFKPITWGTYHWLKGEIKYTSEAPSVEEETLQTENREIEAERKSKARITAEVDYRIDHNERQLANALERDRSHGVAIAPPPPDQPKTRVFVGGDAA